MARRKSNSKSSEIKKALKKAFPSTRFSVTYKSPYGYTVSWENGIIEGAFLDAVSSIANEWDTCENVSSDLYEPYYVGDSVTYEHRITDWDWQKFVIEKVANSYGNGSVYSPKLDCFLDPNGSRAYHENESYYNWLHSGIKCVLNDDRSKIDKTLYYEFDAPKKQKNYTQNSSGQLELFQTEDRQLFLSL